MSRRSVERISQTPDSCKDMPQEYNDNKQQQQLATSNN